MENLELTTEEKKELEKRGFFVKEFLSKKQYFITLFSYLCIYTICVLFIIFCIGGALGVIKKYLGVDINSIFNLILVLYSYIILAGIVATYLYITIKFGVFHYLMISNNGLIINNQSYQYVDQIPTHDLDARKKINDLGGKILSYIKNPGIRKSRNIKDAIGEIEIWLVTVCIAGINIILNIILYTIGLLIMKIMEYTLSLSSFLNLGAKIQKLTPRIEEQSQKIQSEFQSDMSFSVLNDGFDSLSATFSRIIALVLKLEKIEARANKGNLFDSEKYINSLRSDIVEPLRSLREFLENQKTKLLNSQKELTRVRMGGSEESGNIELQSKRSESLITELTENIEKLNVMIGKMGK